MIVIDVKESESIDRALRRYKKKHQRLKMHRELRKRQYFEKPSVKRRNEVLKAKYKEQKLKDMT